MEVKVRLLIQDSGTVPDGETSISVVDTADLRKACERAGYAKVVNNFEQYRRTIEAGASYTELSDEEYALYRAYYTVCEPTNMLEEPPPQDVFPWLINANESKRFTRIYRLTRPGTVESMYVGEITGKLRTRHYGIVQRGEKNPTTEDLRTLSRLLMRKLGQLNDKRSALAASLGKHKVPNPVLAGLLALGAIGTGWAALLLSLEYYWSLHLSLLLMIAAVLVLGTRIKPDKASRNTFAALAVAGMLTSAPLVTWTWNTHERVSDVLVCGNGSYTGFFDDPDGDGSSPDYSPTIITNGGEMALDKGFYNGIFHGSSGSLADVTYDLQGYWVRVLEHGRIGGGSNVDSYVNRFVTRADVLGPGACGDS